MWDVAPCRLVTFTKFSAVLTAYSVRTHRPNSESSTSETSVNYYETTRRNIPEDSHPKTEK
jgi:hypothetical protein